MKYGREEETAAQGKTSCQSEGLTKVSEEMDGFGKGQNYNVITVSEKEWLQVCLAINL